VQSLVDAAVVVVAVVIPPLDFELLEKCLTPEKVLAHFEGIAMGPVFRYSLPQLGALNFVMHNALGGGVTRSLALDPHGKCLSAKLLSLEIE